ncbi:MAG: RIP metalloprotease RseP [Pseudomonadota bacterium]
MDLLATFPATILSYGTYVVTLLVALTVIVFIHEYGHFKVARLCGMKVDTFSIGFGREIWGKNDRYGTRWKIGWLPVGGYVKFAGDANATSMPDPSVTANPDEFHGKPIWQRALVVAAGPVANFILAFFLFAGAFYFLGDQTPGTKLGKILPDSPAQAAGFEVNDIVRKIDGRRVQSFPDIIEIVTMSAGKTLTFDVDRSGSQVSLTVVPRSIVEDRGFYGKFTIGQIGAAPSLDADNFADVSLGRAFELSASQIERIVVLTVQYVGRLIIGQDSVSQLGGVGTMAKLTGDAAQNGLFQYIGMIAVLSVSIGLINLFPIPMLDGGHLVFYALEAIRRKPLGPQAQEWSFRIGFAVVIFIMLVGNINDVIRVAVRNLAY